MELTWTIIPILIIVWLFSLTEIGIRRSDPAANRPPDLVVIGHQWWWEIRYPQSNVITANEIHIPISRQWLVQLESADVIHDFWVPALARKMQMVPGRTNYIWLESHASGTFGGECAEYCGSGHSCMRFSVVAESPATFDDWLRNQEKSAIMPVSDSVQTGLRIFRTNTCINCHSIRGVSVADRAAPDLTHVASRNSLAAGVLPNTEANMLLWLKNPQAIKPGCLMPKLKLTDAQLGSLVSYLETLK